MCFISIIFLVGFTSCSTRTEYRDVPVPVYSVPSPPVISRPELPIHKLTADDMLNSEKIVRAYIVSSRLLLNYAVALEEIVATYKKLSEKSTRINQPVFASAQNDEDTPVGLTTREREIIEEVSEDTRQDAEEAFSSIKRRYEEKEADIRREYETGNN